MAKEQKDLGRTDVGKHGGLPGEKKEWGKPEKKEEKPV